MGADQKASTIDMLRVGERAWVLLEACPTKDAFAKEFEAAMEAGAGQGLGLALMFAVADRQDRLSQDTELARAFAELMQGAT